MTTAHQPAFIPPAGGEPSTSSSLRMWIVLSAVLHVSLAGALFVWKGLGRKPQPTIYRVELIGAPGLKRQAGVVAPEPKAAEPTPTTTAPKAAERPPETVKKPPPPKKTATKPVPKPVTATPNTSKDKPTAAKAPDKTAAKPAAPVAGSGDPKARGTDVASMLQEGIAFPFPGYLESVVRQIKLEFGPKPGVSLTAEFSFLIHRDGSATEIKLLKSSGRQAFDLDAQGAIEAVANGRKFRPLPADFKDDVLLIYYTFVPENPPPGTL